MPNVELSFTYSQSSYIKHKELFKFPSLQNKRGIFVIDFIGNGKSSRALIRQGQLHYKEIVTCNGHVFSFYNENLDPV